jgi:Flp pilus assembly protein TadD
MSCHPLDRGATVAHMSGEEHPVYDLFVEGRQRLADGDAAGAIASLERARDLDPGTGSIREALGVAYLKTARYIDAEAEFSVAVDLAPNDAYRYYLLGRAQLRLGFIGLARGSYKMAHWLDPLSDVYRDALDALLAA